MSRLATQRNVDKFDRYAHKIVNAVEIGRWADMPPAAILATIISVIAVEEDEVRKVVERLGGREEESGAAEDGPADLGPGQGAAHHTGEGAGEADEKG